MPNLEHFLDDIEDLGIEPKKIRIPAQLFDNMLDDAMESIAENPTEEDE